MRGKLLDDKVKAKRIFAFLLSLTSLVACSNPGSSPEERAVEEQAETPFSSQDALSISRGYVLIDFKYSERIRDVKGTIVGTGPAPILAPLLDQPGRYQFSSLKPGTYDFIIEATRLAEEPSQASQSLALRISGVEVRGDGPIFLRDVELLPQIELSGEVKIFGTGPQAGAEISIPGTSYKAVTDAQGLFKLSHVPHGHHQLQVNFTHLTPGLFEKRQYTASENLPALTLYNDSEILPVGIHYEGAPIPPQTEAMVTLFLQRPQGMNMLRWAYSQDLGTAPWLPYQSSLDFKLGPSQRQIFVQFARDRQQLSPIYPIEFAAP